MNLRTKVLSSLCWSAGTRFLGQTITWAITLLVACFLSPGDYGLMSISMICVSFLTMLGELGFGAALIQKRVDDIGLLRRVQGTITIISLLFFLLLYISAPHIANFFNEPSISLVIQVLSFQFVLMGFAVIPQSLLTRDMEFKVYSLVSLVASIIASVSTLVLAVNGAGVWSLVCGSLLLQAVRTVGLNILHPSLVYKPVFSFKGISAIFTFGSFVTIERSLWYFYSQFDSMLIGKLLGKESLGFYSMGLQLASLPMDKFGGIINQVAFPAFSSVQGDSQIAGAHFLKAVRVMSFFAFPMLWGASSVAPEMFSLIFGAKWTPAVLPFQILCLIVPIRMVSNLIAPTMLGMGHPKATLHNTLIAVMVLPIAFVIGSKWGLVGISFGWVVSFPVIFLINMKLVVRILGISVVDVIKNMVLPMLSAMIMYLLVYLTRLNGGLLVLNHVSISLVVFICAGVICYSLTNLIFNKKGCVEILHLFNRSRAEVRQ